MQRVEKTASAGLDRRNWLIVGQPDGAFLHLPETAKAGCSKCENILDAIAMAAQERFDTIFLVMPSVGPAAGTLRTLRRVSGGAKIILLAQMHQEAHARALMRRPGKTTNVVDDYFIRPFDIESFGNRVKVAAPAGREQPVGFVCSDHKDATIRELEKLATHDDLTGLKNRRYVREFLRQIIKQAGKEDLCVTLLYFDIDDFKHYNDTYGHGVGDNVLTQAGIMMGRCCRQHDVVGRIGGDEFAVVFWDRPDEKKAMAGKDEPESERRITESKHPREPIFMAERFRKAIASAELSFLGSGGKGTLTISGGLASFPEDGETVEQLFEQADKAMLEAKRGGKNKIMLVGKAG